MALRDSGRGWVHLYELDVGGTPARAAWDALSAQEQDRARQIRDPARRDRFVVRRAALRRILSRYPAGVRHSSSHSAGLAAVAVAARPVGVDVEVASPRRPHERIAARMFAPEERRLVADAGAGEGGRAFHRCWVAKEAYAKGLGLGLALRFDSFSVAAAAEAPGGRAPVGDGWTVAVASRGDTHVAVAAPGDDWEVVPRG